MDFTVAIVLQNSGAGHPLEVFVVGTDHQVYHRWQEPDAAGGWAPWANLGGSVVTLFGAKNFAGGTLEIFGQGTDGALWHNWQDPTKSSGWSGWASLGKP